MAFSQYLGMLRFFGVTACGRCFVAATTLRLVYDLVFLDFKKVDVVVVALDEDDVWVAPKASLLSDFTDDSRLSGDFEGLWILAVALAVLLWRVDVRTCLDYVAAAAGATVVAVGCCDYYS